MNFIFTNIADSTNFQKYIFKNKSEATKNFSRIHNKKCLRSLKKNNFLMNKCTKTTKTIFAYQKLL